MVDSAGTLAEVKISVGFRLFFEIEKGWGNERWDMGNERWDMGNERWEMSNRVNGTR